MVTSRGQCVLFLRKSWNCSRFDLIVFDRNNFPSILICMAWCMQNLSSIHRLWKKLQRLQGLHHAIGASEKPWNLLKTDVCGGFWRLKIAKSLCSRKISAAHVPRRVETWLVKQIYRSLARVILWCAGQNWKVTSREQCILFLRKSWNCLGFDPIVFDRNNFPSILVCMAWCMQNLSSIHRLWKKL